MQGSEVALCHTIESSVRHPVVKCECFLKQEDISTVEREVMTSEALQRPIADLANPKDLG
jgi:hypothetical protein